MSGLIKKKEKKREKKEPPLQYSFVKLLKVQDDWGKYAFFLLPLICCE